MNDGKGAGNCAAKRKMLDDDDDMVQGPWGPSSTQGSQPVKHDKKGTVGGGYGIYEDSDEWDVEGLEYRDAGDIGGNPVGAAGQGIQDGGDDDVLMYGLHEPVLSGDGEKKEVLGPLILTDAERERAEWEDEAVTQAAYLYVSRQGCVERPSWSLWSGVAGVVQLDVVGG